MANKKIRITLSGNHIKIPEDDSIYLKELDRQAEEDHSMTTYEKGLGTI